ncbi:MAG: acyl-ACP--UDP-N-acetylglucosamine O-acyltransferase [Phycisphaerales bacterium]|nr:acyl-ACP--UDP-N-acetylglucosamine O-acyltransferase [Phycisphaerales bacterium]
MTHPPTHPASPNIHPSAQIHPSAHIDPGARIGADVVIERDVIVGPECSIGEGTRLRDRVVIVERTTIGKHNDIHPYAVLGGDPQDRAFNKDERGLLIVGDNNIIREHVTLNRSTGNEVPTRLGSGCMLMSASHMGHNCQVGDRVVMANACILAGHSRIGDGCVLSGSTAVHQFTHVGQGVMFRGGAMVSQHVPPFVIVGDHNRLSGLNRVGLRRNPAMKPEDRTEATIVYRALFRDREGTPIREVLAELRSRSWNTAATRMLDFVEDALSQTGPRARGLCTARALPVRAGVARDED